MWGFLLGLFAVLAVVGVVYLVTRFHRFSFVRKFGETHKVLAWLVSLLPVAILGLFTLINIYAAVIVVVHMLVIWLLCDLVAWMVRKCRRKERGVRYVAGIVAIGVSFVYLSTGWFFAHHVFETTYSFTTEKDPGGTLRIVAIADAHLGITLDGEGFAQELERVQKTNPDVVVLCGDFVDDDSCKTDMIEACRALGDLQTTYGVYFIFGNHDKGYYRYRDFTSQELRDELQKNGVVILEDEAVLVDDRFYIIGRQDRSMRNRMGMDELTAELDSTKFTILLDHQPNDYANEAASGVDLVLSGHTHGGHIFPGGLIGVWIGANDRAYGTEVRGGTRFLVTSGISGWAIPFKTGTISEYAVIDIQG